MFTVVTIEISDEWTYVTMSKELSKKCFEIYTFSILHNFLYQESRYSLGIWLFPIVIIEISVGWTYVSMSKALSRKCLEIHVYPFSILHNLIIKIAGGHRGIWVFIVVTIEICVDWTYVSMSKELSRICLEKCPFSILHNHLHQDSRSS